MGLIWLALAAVALWALIRLGRQTEKTGRRHWRVTATLLSAVMVAGGLLAGARGGWFLAVGLIGGGIWLAIASRQSIPAPRSEGLSLKEARDILGVAPDADAAAVNAAWRRLMARAHPDQGGTEGLAARLNAARDRLLKG